MKIESKYSYSIFPADDFNCVASLLKSIISIYGYNMAIEEIASNFIKILPMNIENNFNDNMLGIHIYENSINNFFNKYSIPLEERWIPINTLEEWEFKTEIVNGLKNNEHIICGFSYGIYYNDKTKNDIGHVVLIKSIVEEKVSVIDPGPEKVGMNDMEMYRLYKAIHHKKDGIWKIKEKNLTKASTL